MRTAALCGVLLWLAACGGTTVTVSSAADDGVCVEVLSGGSGSSSASENSDDERPPQISGPDELSAAEFAELLEPLAAQLQNSDDARFDEYRSRVDSVIGALRSVGAEGEQEALDQAFFLVNQLRAVCTVELLRDAGTPS